MHLKSDMLKGATSNIFFTSFDPINGGGLDIQVPPSSSQGDSECQQMVGDFSNIYGEELYGDEMMQHPDHENWVNPDDVNYYLNKSDCKNNTKGVNPSFMPQKSPTLHYAEQPNQETFDQNHYFDKQNQQDYTGQMEETLNEYGEEENEQMVG